MTRTAPQIRQRIVFLVSGGGGNMRFIHRAIQDGWLPEAALVRVIADRQCPALAYCAEKDIPHEVVRYTRSDPDALRASLDDAAPDLIVTNVHKIIDADTLHAFEGRFINLHYSLLPAFAGLIGAEPIREALDHGCTIVGTTVHHVIEAVDAGSVISQSVLPVRTTDLDSLMEDVFRSGCVNLLSAIRSLGSHQALPQTAAFISPATGVSVSDFPDALWRDIAHAS